MLLTIGTKMPANNFAVKKAQSQKNDIKNNIENNAQNNLKQASPISFGAAAKFSELFDMLGKGDPVKGKEIHNLRMNAQRISIELFGKKRHMENTLEEALVDLEKNLQPEFEQAKKVYSKINAHTFDYKDFMFAQRYKLIKEGVIRNNIVRVYAESSNYSDTPLGGVFVIEKIVPRTPETPAHRVVSRFESNATALFC